MIGASAAESYADLVINPGSRPVEGATEVAAEASLRAFVAEAVERGLRLAGEPERQPNADIDGRYAWSLPLQGGDRARILMPGVGLTQLRDDLTAQKLSSNLVSAAHGRFSGRT